MNAQRPSSKQPLEAMLRRWGLEEAAARAEVGSAPLPRPGGRRLVLLRWAPLAAAAGLLVAAGLFYWHAETRRGKAADGNARLSGAVAAATARQKKDLAAMRAALERIRSQLTAAEARLAKLPTDRDAMMARLARLQEDFSAQEQELAAAKRRQAELQAAAAAKDAELRKMKTALGQLQKVQHDLAEARRQIQQHRTELSDLQGKLTGVTTEAARLNERLRSAVAVREKLTGELAAMNAWQDVMLRTSQQEYLAARQVIARRSRLLQRCGQLRPLVRGEAAGPLFDRLEVLLTRLDMLDASDADAIQSFQSLLRQSELSKRIGEALASAEEPEILAWLTEARLVLTGVGHAG